ncbi:MAG: hypothetical protein ACI8W7_001819 [Gammaproteobacteria bacterium]|jgi:hypothetical protein
MRIEHALGHRAKFPLCMFGKLLVDTDLGGAFVAHILLLCCPRPALTPALDLNIHSMRVLALAASSINVSWLETSFSSRGWRCT